MPVLTDGERVIAYGRFSEKRLRKELRALMGARVDDDHGRKLRRRHSWPG